MNEPMSGPIYCSDFPMTSTPVYASGEPVAVASGAYMAPMPGDGYRSPGDSGPMPQSGSALLPCVAAGPTAYDVLLQQAQTIEALRKENSELNFLRSRGLGIYSTAELIEEYHRREQGGKR